MEQIVKTLFKKAISALVCIMMVAATFPVHMLNSAVFATDQELNLTLPKDMDKLKALTESDLKDITSINLSVNRDWTPGVETFKPEYGRGSMALDNLISPDGEQFVIKDAEIDGKTAQLLVLKEDDDAGKDPTSSYKYKITGMSPVNLKFSNGLDLTADARLFMSDASSDSVKITLPYGDTWNLSGEYRGANSPLKSLKYGIILFDDDILNLSEEYRGANSPSKYVITSPDGRTWTSVDEGGNWTSSDGKTWTSVNYESFILFDGTVLAWNEVKGVYQTPSGDEWTVTYDEENKEYTFTSPIGEKWKVFDSRIEGCSMRCSGKTLDLYPAMTLKTDGDEIYAIIHPDFKNAWFRFIGMMPLMNAFKDLVFSFNIDLAGLSMSKDYLFDFGDPKFAGKTINFKSSDGKTKKIDMPNDIGFLKADGCKVNCEGLELNGGQDYTDYVYQNPKDLKNPLTKDLISVKDCELNLGKGMVVENFVGLFACAIGAENSTLTMTEGAKVCNFASYGFFDYSKSQPEVTGGATKARRGRATGEEATGEEATGEEATGEEATGEEATGEEATGEEATDEEATDEEATDEEATGEEAEKKKEAPKSFETTRGGAIRLLDNSTLVLNGCLIDKCSCFSNRRACGGAIYSRDSFIEFLKGTISNSRSVSGSTAPYGCSYGGGIYAQRSELNFQNGQISRCRAIETEGINARCKGDAVYLEFGCKHKFSDAFRITLHEDDENDLHNLDEKITGRCGVYIFRPKKDEQESYYEVPIEGQDPIYIRKDQLENSLLPILKDMLVRAEDGAVFLKAETETGVPITEETKLKDILSSDDPNITQQLVPTYDESEMHVSTYYMLQKAIYGAKGNRRIILDSDIFIDETCKPASEIDEFGNTLEGYCFSDNSRPKKNITLESKDASEPKMIQIKKSDFGLFAMQKGTLTLKNIKLDGGNFNSEDEQGHFINISKKSVLNLEEGTLIQNVYKNSYNVIYLNGGKLNINGAYIIGCKVVYAIDKPACGGAIYSKGGKIVMNSGGIVDCFAETTEPSGKALGGAICAIENSSLEICGGGIEGCYVQYDQSVKNVTALGDAIYFNGDDEGYNVALPNGDLKINIPAKFISRGHNSSPKMVGYQGIYKKGVDQEVEDEDDFDYYEIKLDVDGGVDQHNSAPSCVYVPVSDAESCLKDFLPSDLHKGEASISQWIYEISDGEMVVLEDETVSEVIEQLGENALKPIYYAQEEHVSTAADLQKAIYDAKGNKVIILAEDIQITEDLLDAAENRDLEKSNEYAFSGYYLSDNSSLGEKSIIIKSEDSSDPKTISLLKAGSGLLALQNASLTLENVIVDGLGADPGEEGEKIEGTTDYIQVESGSALILAQGSLIKDVYRKNAKVIFLSGGNLTIDGGYITNCSVNYDEDDACGGAVYSKDGKVEMYSGGITYCCAIATGAGCGAFGGGIYAVGGSELDLQGGIIIGCDIKGDPKDPEIKSRGNEIYFDGNHENYKVAKPGGKLKINIPAGYDNTPYNLDARIVGYQGIYLANITDGEVDDLSDAFAYYEILIDADGGVDENGYHCGNAIYVDKNVKDTRILKYLPVYLEKGELVLSGWYRDGEAVTEYAKIDHFLQEGSQNRTCVIRAMYKYRTDEVHVSNYSDLQKALYSARGVKTIILDSDIEIDDSFKGIDQEIYPSAAPGYCFSDDIGVSNKVVTIKSSDGNKFKIINKNSGYGLLAIREGSIKFENVVLDGSVSAGNEDGVSGGAGSSQDVNFIDVSRGATLKLGKGTEIKNIIGRSAVGLVGANLEISDGCMICDCKGVNGGAINASSGSEVNMLGGLLTKCRAANGGAIYAVDSSLNIQKGEISRCFANENGDAVYFSGEGTLSLASPNGGLKITIPLDNNSHNSCGKIFGYWGIYKEGIGDCTDHLQDEKYYELEINANGGVDRYGHCKINPVYISNEQPMLKISILKYLPTDLTKRGKGVFKWVHCLKDIDVTEDTKMQYCGLEYCDIIFNRVKAIYDDVSFEDAFGGCLSDKECVYGDEYDLSAISKNGVDDVKYEIVEGHDVAKIDGDKLKIVGAGKFKLKAITASSTYIKSIGVKPKDLSISGIKINDKEYDGRTRATYTLESDKTGSKFKTLKEAYDYILNRDKESYGDPTDPNCALNVLKALGLDLVSAHDADILSKNLDKIVFEFDDPEVGQNKKVDVKVVKTASAPAEFLNIIKNKYKLSLADDCRASITISFEDAFGGCLSDKECVYGDEYDLSDISKDGVDGVKYEVVEGHDVAEICDGKLKILGAGKFKLKATAQGATYTMAIVVKPKDLSIGGIRINDKEYDGRTRATYTLESDTEGTKFKTLKGAYQFILGNGLYDGDGEAENRALNVLKALGLDLVSAHDADILSKNLDKIVFEFDDSGIGQNKKVDVKFKTVSAPDEFLNIINNKYKLSLADDCRASITAKKPKKDIDVVARLNSPSEHAGVSIFHVLNDKNLNVSDRFGLLFKDRCEIEIIPKDTSCAISKILYFKSPKLYLNTRDLNRDAKWAEDADGDSDGVRYGISYAANGKISRVCLDIHRKAPSEKFFLYLKIVGEGEKVRYLRSEGIVLYSESKPLENEYKHAKSSGTPFRPHVQLNDNKFYAIKSINKDVSFSAERLFLKTDYQNSVLEVYPSVFYFDEDGKNVYKVSYIPGCCEKEEIANENLLPFFNLNVELK